MPCNQTRENYCLTRFSEVWSGPDLIRTGFWTGQEWVVRGLGRVWNAGSGSGSGSGFGPESGKNDQEP